MGAIKEIRKWLVLAFFNFQLYSFNLNLPFHDSFHPRTGEPNRGGGRDTNLKKGKEKKKFYKQYQLSQNNNYSMY